MIFLQPHSGLANRIRVIVSGLSFAKLNNQQLIIIWEKDAGLNCTFDDLFKEIPNVIIKRASIKFRFINWIKNKKLLRVIFYKFFKIDFALFDTDFPRYVWSTKSDYINMTLLPPQVSNYYIRACNEFSPNYTYLTYLVPVKTIQELIDLEVRKFPKQIIGIHIRRTDNDQSIKESPLNLFVEKIEADLIEDKQTHYFLATDAPIVEKELLTLFPSNIIVAKKHFTRNSQEGIVGAMVDMYCLAATTKIYGSYGSSFSSVAARIGNIPLIVVKK